MRKVKVAIEEMITLSTYDNHSQEITVNSNLTEIMEMKLREISKQIFQTSVNLKTIGVDKWEVSMRYPVLSPNSSFLGFIQVIDIKE